jgi:hypothetical protein
MKKLLHIRNSMTGVQKMAVLLAKNSAHPPGVSDTSATEDHARCCVQVHIGRPCGYCSLSCLTASFQQPCFLKFVPTSNSTIPTVELGVWQTGIRNACFLSRVSHKPPEKIFIGVGTNDESVTPHLRMQPVITDARSPMAVESSAVGTWLCGACRETRYTFPERSP